MRTRKLSIFLFGLLIFTVGINSARAGQYDIKEMTPPIQQALSGRQSRFGDLQSLKTSGAVGEDNQGYIKVLNDLPGASQITAAENGDREIIYNAIVSQNGLSSDGLSQVQAVFAEVQRDKARSGDSIQLPSGEWTKK